MFNITEFMHTRDENADLSDRRRNHDSNSDSERHHDDRGHSRTTMVGVTGLSSVARQATSSLTTVASTVSHTYASSDNNRRDLTSIMTGYGLSMLQNDGNPPPLTTHSAASVTPAWPLDALALASNYLQQAEGDLAGTRRRSGSCGSVSQSWISKLTFLDISNDLNSPII